MNDIGILEICGIVAAISAGLGGPIAMVRWCASYVTAKVQDEAHDRDAAILALSVAMAAKIEPVAHKASNSATRIDALERLRTSDIERIVKVETAVLNFDKAIERIEHGQEKLSDSLNGRFDMLAESIREIRTVGPR